MDMNELEKLVRREYPENRYVISRREDAVVLSELHRGDLTVIRLVDGRPRMEPVEDPRRAVCEKYLREHSL